MLVSDVDFKSLFREKKTEGSRTLPFLFMMFSGVLVFPETMRTVMGSLGARSVHWSPEDAGCL